MVSHDQAEDGFHEIQLSGKQVVALFMGAAFVLSFTFLLGVLIGRGAKEVRADQATASAAAGPTVDVPPQPLSGSGPPATEPPAPAEVLEDLSYHNRLQGAGAPAEDLKPQRTTPPADKPAPPAPRAAAPADVPTSGRPGTHVIQVFVSRDRNAAVALVKKLGGSGYPAFLVVPESPSVPQMYKVQVGRYGEREAEKVAEQLEKEGDFKPWVISSR